MKAIIEAAIDGIITIDEEGIIETINLAAAHLFGYGHDELIGSNIGLLMSVPFQEEHNDYIQRYLQIEMTKVIGIGREVNGKRKDGAVFPLRLAISKVSFKGKQFFVGIVQDLTEIKHTQYLLQHLVENLPSGAVYRNEKELILNKKAEAITGYQKTEITTINDWFNLLYKERADKVKSFYNHDKKTGFPKSRIESIITRQGHVRYIEFSAFSDEFGEIWLMNDITKRILAETEIHHLNKELEQKTISKTEELANTVDRLLLTNKQLEAEVQERKVIEETLRYTEQELRESLKKEKELNELKSRFITMASHEFRTPLSSILSSTELIEAYTSVKQQPKRQKHIRRIKSAIHHLTDILNDFLSLDKLEEGKIVPQIVEFDMNNLCLEVIEEMQGMLKPNQSVDHTDLSENQMVTLDKKALKSILFNLLSNAIKYSKEGQTINCNTGILNNQLTIKIEDHGIGIPEKDQKHLFTRFFRAHNVENIQGTGLGLNIVKQYIELMKGRIDFKSEIGIGTTFIVQIPLQN